MDGSTHFIDADHFGLRHVLIGKPNTFSPQTSVHEATERHGIEPIIGRIIDHHATGFNLARQFQGLGKIACEQTRVQAVFRRVGQSNGTNLVASLTLQSGGRDVDWLKQLIVIGGNHGVQSYFL